MEAMHKFEWDYLGWKKYGEKVSYSQKDWNQTLQTAINQVSAKIHKESKRGSANYIYVHPKTFCLFKTLEYFHEHDSGGTLSGRYKVIIDDKIHHDKIILKFIDKFLMDARETNPNFCYGIKETINNPNELGELSLIYLDSSDTDSINDSIKNGFNIITDEKLMGEITINNNFTIDPITGEILVDYHTEISQDYWIPSPEKEIGQLVDLLPGATMEERTKKIKKLLDYSKVFVNNVNEPTTKTFVVPIVKEEEKKIKISLFQRLKNIINKTK